MSSRIFALSCLLAVGLLACSQGSSTSDPNLDATITDSEGLDEVDGVTNGDSTSGRDSVGPGGESDGQEPSDSDDVVVGQDNGGSVTGDTKEPDKPITTSCATDDDCPDDQHCCTSLFGGGSCKPAGEECGGGFDFGGCTSDEDCAGDGMVCCDFMGSFQMCMAAEMCPGEAGGCQTDEDCTVAGQVCCKFGEMAEAPMCMAEGMCPKDCTTDDDCPSHQECCDLNTEVVCVDRGQCPQKCLHSSKECPLGEVCCDAGDGLLICVSNAECPGSVPCSGPEHVCTNSEGKPNGDECCEVPELGFRCVGSGGCDDWETCLVDTDCRVGRECCALEGGPTCVPTGACPDQGLDLPPCSGHGDCIGNDEICCIVPGQGSVCATTEQCPSSCFSNSDCAEGIICCALEGSAAHCMTAADCEVGKACKDNSDCSEGNTCCDMAGSKTCMPEGQCMGTCENDDDCEEGSVCCNMFGMKMCFPGGCPM